MDNQIEQNLLLGFDQDSITSSLISGLKYKQFLKEFEETVTHAASRHSFSMMKYYEDRTSSSNTSLKGMVTDNDSGYISQNMESNSSVEASDNRQVIVSSTDSRNVYVNEDTLLEKPYIATEHDLQNVLEEEEYEEFGHLFYMAPNSEPVLESSVVSQNTSFSGFDGDESGVSDISSTISIATPIVVSSKVLNIDSIRNEDVNNSLTPQNHSVTSDVFVPFTGNNTVEFLGNSKENTSTDLNVKGSLKLISPIHEPHTMEHKSLHINKNDLNSIQTRLMDASACDMSLFESFYSHLCGLYTRNDFPAEDLTKIAINPHNLQIINQIKENASSNSPCRSSYLQLESIIKPTTVVESSTNIDISVPEKNELPRPTTVENYFEHKIEQPEVKNDKNNTSIVSVEKKPATPMKQYKNPVNSDLSPELFSDEEPLETVSKSFSEIQKICEQMYITKNDRKLLKRAQESLGGVPPPPCVTIMQISVGEMLQKIKDNNHLFVKSSDNNDTLNTLNVSSSAHECVKGDNTKSDNVFATTTSKRKEMEKSLLVTCRKEDVVTEKWPRIMQYRYHGLHHNRSKVSEDFEQCCLKYAERYIGVETQSSCTAFGMDALSPSKRKYKLKRVSKSPGKRLSHLARRRITFSKDSLQSGVGPSSCSFIGARTRQIMVDARKFELLSRRKSPRKKTPSKSPRKKQTPSSSTKKRFATRLRMYNNDESMDSVASTSSSSRASVTKRALFQSPSDKGETTNGLLQLFGSNISSSDLSQSAKRRTPRRALFTSPLRTSPTKMSISSLYPPKRKATPKRALFMSPGKSQSKASENCDKKRKRMEMDDEHPSKLQRSTALGVKDSLNESKSRTMTRSQSQTGSAGLQGQDMAEHRKKKLIWAVAEALRSQNIDMKHPQFKVFASVLARVIRHFLPNLFNNGPRPEGSSTESMLRIARQHVFAVTRGKTANQIIRESESNKTKPTKPSGYVGLDKVEKVSDAVQIKNKENVLQDRVNIIGSDRLGSESSRTSKISRGENVERIRRVINFGDDDIGNSNIR